MDNTLLLNASYEPIKVIPWQRAITLSFLGKVEVVDVYEREIRSVSIVLKVPAVVRLLRYIHLGKRRPPLTRVNLLTRDEYQCQYCAKSLSVAESTIDHIIPRSQGGTTDWRNVVAACHPCNRRKGGRTPLEARMQLLREPVAPEWLPVLTFGITSQTPIAWRLFLARSES